MVNTVRLLLVVLLASAIGCQQHCLNTYVEGTSLTFGLYFPYNGQIYGIQAVNYLSGKKIQLSTNHQFKVDSQHSISNRTFGLFENYDCSKVRID